MSVSIHNFDAWVTVGGEALKNYYVEHTSDTSATCWIPARLGQEFSVNWTANAIFQNSGRLCSAWLFHNGNLVGATNVPNFGREGFGFTNVPNVMRSDWFQGCKHIPIDGVVSACGEIKLDIWTVRPANLQMPLPTQVYTFDYLDNEDLATRIFDPPQIGEASSSGRYALATFTFKYLFESDRNPEATPRFMEVVSRAIETEQEGPAVDAEQELQEGDL